MGKKSRPKISERHSRLRRRVWRRMIAGIISTVFIGASLVLDVYAGRTSPTGWVSANSFFTVVKIGYYDGPIRADTAQWRADYYLNPNVMTSWSDLCGHRIPPLWPIAWANGGGLLNVIVPLWPVPAFFFGSMCVWWRLATLEKKRHICRCGYSLAGLTSETCPECERTLRKPADA